MLDWLGRHHGDAPFAFPFSSRLQEDEPPSLQHVRDYSNYLFPHGVIDVLRNASIYLRGLLVNAVLVSSVLFFATALTLAYYSLRGSWFAELVRRLDYAHQRYFSLTIDLALALAALGILWGLLQSSSAQAAVARRAPLLTGFSYLVLAVLLALFCELQPFILDAMIEQRDGSAVVTIADWIQRAVKVLAPVAAALAFLANKLGEYVKSSMQSPRTIDQVKGAAVKAAIYVGGLIVPALLWLAYLDVSYWGICINSHPNVFINPPPRCPACTAPQWLADAAYWAADMLSAPRAHAATVFYALAAALCFLLSLFMRPNANSLHPLYRTRLAKAFMFEPMAQTSVNDLPELNPCPRLSKICSKFGPYHLINAALNIQASKTANRRGRNADFFIFSKLFVGSKTTDYVKTLDVEDIDPNLDLATAMAVSGAAVSSNMGAESIKPLTATLALLNIRLGYWLRNPQKLRNATRSAAGPVIRHVLDYLRTRNFLANYYFLAEIFGWLTEKRRSIYLTDGGHIENLGIYELLRRRCRVIIAVDAEADPQMAFGSFNNLERYALIDMGIRIDLPWQKIADESLATGKLIDNKGDAPKHHGPHCAIGEITYPNDRKGILVYIKASLTGDENDYVFDYKKRYSAFPHETTLDQMFTEEQFEAYRALGFHAAYQLFSGADTFAHLEGDENAARVRAQVAFLNELFGIAAAGV